jgi:hypothetical protein
MSVFGARPRLMIQQLMMPLLVERGVTAWIHVSRQLNQVNATPSRVTNASSRSRIIMFPTQVAQQSSIIVCGVLPRLTRTAITQLVTGITAQTHAFLLVQQQEKTQRNASSHSSTKMSCTENAQQLTIIVSGAPPRSTTMVRTSPANGATVQIRVNRMSLLCRKM